MLQFHFLESIWCLHILVILFMNLPSPSFALIGGKKAKHGQYPWHVTIHVDDDPGRVCSGSIVNTKWVLTSAKCVRLLTTTPDVQAKHLKVFASERDNKKQFQVSRHKVNWQYNGSRSDYTHDIALIEIAEEFSSESQLKVPISDEKPNDFSNCTLTGWRASSKMSLEVKILQNSVCTSKFTTLNFKDKLCAAPKYKDGSLYEDKFDIGAPLVCYSKETRYFLQVGVVSYIDTSQDSGFLVAFTDVHFHRTWLCLESGELCDDTLSHVLKYLIPVFVVFGCCFATCTLMMCLGKKPKNRMYQTSRVALEQQDPRPSLLAWERTPSTRMTSDWVNSIPSKTKAGDQTLSADPKIPRKSVSFHGLGSSNKKSPSP